MKKSVLFGIALLVGVGLNAKEFYNPWLDPACRVVTPVVTNATWDAAYMWYPGQLQAYLQADILKASRARCVNVDYPSRYNPRVSKTFFRTRQKVGAFRAVGRAERTCDGSWTVIEVNSTNGIPALIAQGTRPTDWEASLDGKVWNVVESDLQYNRPDVSPDQWVPELVEIPSFKRISSGENEWIEDFRYVAVGTVSFSASGKGKLALVPGETTLEAKCDNPSVHEQYPLEVLSVDGEGVRFELPERAMRYLRFSVLEGTIEVKDVILTAKMEKVRFAFSFESDDPTFNKLFDAGLATVHESMSRGFHIDGLKRDFLPWSMDATLSVLAATWCLDNRQIIRNDISIGVMPPSPRVEDWACVDYPLHAMIAIEADWQRHHDLSTFKMFRERLESQLALYEKCRGKDGFVAAGRTAFFGFLPSWARYNGPENYGTPAYAQMILALNYDLYARFYSRLGEEARAAHCLREAATLKAAIKAKFWDAARGAFINGYREDGSLDTRLNHHSQYWAILAGIFPAEGYDKLFDEVLPKIPRYYTDVSYEKGYELLAYQKAGRAKDFYNNFLMGAWQDWLGQGHTAFPEQFNVGLEKREQICFYGRPFGRSLCHGTNGMVPVLFALRSALGFEEGPQAGEYSFTPTFVGKATKYRARLQMKEGEIILEAEKGKKAKVTAPAGVKVTVNGMNLNGERWLDSNGVMINAHGGGILFHEGRFWWFGEHKGFDAEGYKAKVGVHVYSSTNLADWRDEGIALAVSTDPTSDIHIGNIIERPKVVRSPKTGKFVMFFHLELDGQGYNAARVGIAVADSVAGPYKFIRSLRPLAGKWPYDVPERFRTAATLAKVTDELDIRTYRGSSYNTMPMFGNFFEGGQMVRDQTLFTDDDGKVYHIYASEGNATLQIAELTEDCLDYTGRFARVHPRGFNEAPAICHRGKYYYMITSDCTGWAPNPCRAYRAENIFGPWLEIGNPCLGVNPRTGLGAEKTWGGQSTFILRVPNAADKYIAMFDEWHPDSLGDSRYYWLPIHFTPDGRIEITWREEAPVLATP